MPLGRTTIDEIPFRWRGAVKKCRRVWEPGLQRAGKVFGILVGRVPSRGVFNFFTASGVQGWVGTNREDPPLKAEAFSLRAGDFHGRIWSKV